MKPYQRALFIFRRDLRVDDNTGLLAALEQAEEVIPIFIFDPRQCLHNTYINSHFIQFMLESLDDLKSDLRRRGGELILLYGEYENVVTDLLKVNAIDAVFFNRDYTPYSQTRDQKIESICMEHSIGSHAYHDALLIPPGEGLKSDGQPYLVFTPFYRNALRLPISLPRPCTFKNFYHSKPIISDHYLKPYSFDRDPHYQPACQGGRQAALECLEQLCAKPHYSDERDFPAKASTSLLSPHLKLTTVSPREILATVQSQLKNPEGFIRELYWRDFFTHIAYHFPHVFGHAFHQRLDEKPWENNEDFFDAWKSGTTGFPIVDAGMRQLNQTGHMHNRVRMITASFLIKDLHIDWRWGEKYFAQTLVDYDPAVNNGNWQWVAGTGTDAQPYYRIFNPWIQQKKFDPDAEYIKTWVPELAGLSPKEIHDWQNSPPSLFTSYPKPIVDHAIEASKAKKLWG